MAKGKSIADDIISGLESVTRTWTKQRKAEERHASARANRQMRMMRWSRTTQREVVFEKMEEAYLKASANGTLPANCRQIYCAIRPKVQAMADQRAAQLHLFPNPARPIRQRARSQLGHRL